MAELDVASLLRAVQNAKALVDALFARLQALPDFVIGEDEEKIRAALNDALEGFDLAGAEASIGKAIEALKRGKSIAGGGFNANLS